MAKGGDSARSPTPERLAGFSDGVIAVIITIMVLELKAPLAQIAQGRVHPAGNAIVAEDARRPVEGEHYNNVRLNSAVGYLDHAEKQRQIHCQQAA